LVVYEAAVKLNLKLSSYQVKKIQAVKIILIVKFIIWH